MQKFRSKKEWWVLAFIVCMTGLIIQLLVTMQAKGNIAAYPVHTATYVITVFILWWPIVNTRYIVDEKYLTIHCMFLTWKIQLTDIQRISKTNNSVASPALSLDRLKVEYTKNGENKFILVSPKQQKAFCDALNMQFAP